MMTIPTSQVLATCQISDRLFAINPRFRRANFYSQQLRALALIEEMLYAGLISSPNRNFIVIGAGVCGLTVAASLITCGASVTIIDKNESMLQYKDASHRELHPNIINWPFQELRSITDLPFLNWSCQTAAEVVKDIMSQWEKDFARCVSVVRDRVSSISETNISIKVNCISGDVFETDRVIVATGYLNERTVGDQYLNGYWEPYQFSGHNPVVVSGSGDGGLIDGVYQFFGPKTTSAVRRLAYSLQKKPQKEDIEAVEMKALEIANSGDEAAACSLLESFYRKFSLEQDEKEILNELRLKTTPNVRIVHRSSSVYSPYTSPINKIVVSAMNKDPFCNLIFVKGEVQKGISSNEVILSCNGSVEQLDKNRTLIRHGAPAAAYKILDDNQTAIINSKSSKALNDHIKDGYSREIYIEHPKRRVAPSETFRKAEFYSRLKRRVNLFLNHISPDIQLKSSCQGKPWRVIGDASLQRDLASSFPINIGSVKIELSRSAPVQINCDD